MKTKLLLLAILLTGMFSCQQPVQWTVENPLAVERPDEALIFTRDQLASKLELPDGKLPVFKIDGQLQASQVDDLDGDSVWDEAVVVIDLAASEKKALTVEFVAPEAYPQFEKRTNVRLGIVQPDGSFVEVDNYQAPSIKEGFRIIAQGESVSWENDKFGFRNYFDCRNVKDLFGKLKPELIIDKIHTPEMGDYHKLADWGMDVLHCGSSLGSGGIALMKNDSLFRLGSTEGYEYQKITEGPVRSVLELRYSGWVVDGDTLSAVERISIFPGKYWFQSDVTFLGSPEGSEVVTGIVTSLLKREPFQFTSSGYTCIGTHDVQSLNNDELGMAVLVAENETGKIGRTTDINFFKLGHQTVVEKNFSNIISETYYISQKTADGIPARHYFAAVWGLEKEQWKTEEGFRKYLTEEMEKLGNPISVQ